MNRADPFRRLLHRNAHAHDRVAHAYDEKHSEIYNPIEQSRLDEAISDVLGLVSASTPEVLDFGAGTGNLTLKFLARGCRVTAADVSARSLEELLRKARGHGSVSSVLLDGDGIPFPEASFDVVATYSVLHHIPDYLVAVREMVRVLRPGGIVFIDHEFNEAAWRGEPALAEYRGRTRLSVAAHLAQLVRTRELFTLSFAKTVFMKALINPRYEREGDIHVWPDDHIEWDRVADVLDKAGASIVVSRDYLLYQPRGGVALYRRYHDLCTDTRCLIARKRG